MGPEDHGDAGPMEDGDDGGVMEEALDGQPNMGDGAEADVEYSDVKHDENGQP